MNPTLWPEARSIGGSSMWKTLTQCFSQLVRCLRKKLPMASTTRKIQWDAIKARKTAYNGVATKNILLATNLSPGTTYQYFIPVVSALS